jgi:DNA (cytosine-5)-methyltransferase 1
MWRSHDAHVVLRNAAGPDDRGDYREDVAVKYMSVCSGIEAATQAWAPLGWKPVAFSEIEKFPCAVLAHHYPDVPNWGDMTRFQEWPDAAFDVLCGGTPCQSFSVAGLRQGLADPRGNLMLTFGAIAGRYRPRWLVWENVPGVLSSNGGRDFGAFLGMLGELWYGVAYRVLDAQHVRTRRFPFAVPQRRRRVFVVGYLGDWRRAAAVLFDRESLSGHPAPRRQAGQVAPTIPARSLGGGGLGTDFDCDGGLICADIAPTLNAHFGDKQGLEDQHINGGGGLFVATRDGGAMPEGPHDTANIRAASGGSSRSYIAAQWAVRRLTPVECERLQAFPDDFTRIPYRGKPADKCPDGPRYKALGNSWAVNCAEWIGDRIAEVDTWKEQAS